MSGRSLSRKRFLQPPLIADDARLPLTREVAAACRLTEGEKKTKENLVNLYPVLIESNLDRVINPFANPGKFSVNI